MRKKKNKYRYVILSLTACVLLIVILLIVILKPNSIKKVKNAPINKVVINDSEEINRNLIVKNQDKNVVVKEVKITKDDILRKDKSSNSKIIASLKKGDVIIILNKDDNGWCKVKYKDNEGYVKSSSIEEK